MKLMNSTLPFLVIFAFLTIVGCNTDAGVNNDSQLNFESGAFALFDFEDAVGAVEDATLENLMRMDPGLFNGDFFRNDGPFGPRGPRGPFGRGGPSGMGSRFGKHLGSILRDLDLTEEQRTQMRELMTGHRECVQEPLQAFREANKGVIAAANEQRQAIKDAFENGHIAREEARQQLRELSESTRNAIRNNPDNEPFKEALCACKLAHFDNIRAGLNETQQATWDAWVASLEGGCFSSEG